MQNLSNVVSCRTEQNGVLVDLQIGPATLKGIKNLGGCIVNEGKVKIVSAWEVEAIKTKSVESTLGTLATAGLTVVVDTAANEKLRLSTRNLANATFLPPEGVNVYDLLRHDTLILTKEAAKALETRLSA